MRAADAAILGKPDTAVRIKVARLDLAYGCLHQSAKLPPLFFRNRRPQVLDLGLLLPDKHDKCHLGNPTDPRIADELRVERKQPIRAVWVATGSGFPINQAARAVNLSDGIHVCHKLGASGERPQEFSLKIFRRMVDANTVVLGKPLEQMNTLVNHTVPGVSLFVLKRGIAIRSPLLEQGRPAILPPKVGCKGALKAA